MGIFARAAAKAFDQGAGTLAVGAHIINIGAGRSASGISITTDRALKYSAFWAAVRILSEDMAKLPLGVFEEMPDGSHRPAPEHPVNRVIRYQANPQMSAFTWREVGMAHLVTWGNSYSLKVRDGMGRLRELWPLATDRMEVERDPTTGELRYRYTRVNGTQVDLTQSQVFHVPGLSWDGVQGYSLIKMARETIGLGLATEEHGSRFFSNGVTTNFVLSTDNKLSDDAHKHLDEQVKDDKTGLTKAWEPWVLEEGLKPIPLSMPNDDAQWLETRKHQVTDISRWSRVPLHKLGDLEHAHFTNIEEQNQEYADDALMGWAGRHEAAYGMQLLGPDWLGAGGRYFTRYTFNALLRANFEKRMTGYATGRQWGWLSANDIRRLEDMDPIEGGDDYLVPLNMTSVGPDGTITTTTMARAGASSNGTAAAAGASST